MVSSPPLDNSSSLNVHLLATPDLFFIHANVEREASSTWHALKQKKRTHLLPKMLRSCAKLKRLYSKVCRAIAQKCSNRSSTMTTALSRWKLSCDVPTNWKCFTKWHEILVALRNYTKPEKQIMTTLSKFTWMTWIHPSAALRMQRNHSIEPSKDPFCGLVMSCAAICCPKCLKHSMLEW